MPKERQLAPSITDEIFKMEKVEAELKKLMQSQWFIESEAKVLKRCIEYAFDLFNLSDIHIKALFPRLPINSMLTEIELYIKASITSKSIVAESIDDETESRAIELLMDRDFIMSALKGYENKYKRLLNDAKSVIEGNF